MTGKASNTKEKNKKQDNSGSEDSEVMKFDRESLSNELLKDYIDENDRPRKKIAIQLGTRHLKFIVPALVFLVIGTSSLAVIHYRIGKQTLASNEIPVVKAQRDPVRKKPDDPGGMVIANQDKMIYQNIANATKDNEVQPLPEVSRILSKTEEPIDRNSLAVISNSEDPFEQTNQNNDVKSDSQNQQQASHHPQRVLQYKMVESKPILSSRDAAQTNADNTNENVNKSDDSTHAPELIVDHSLDAKASTASNQQNNAESNINNAQAKLVSKVENAALAVEVPTTQKQDGILAAGNTSNQETMQVSMLSIKKSSVPIRRGRVLTLPDPTLEKHAFSVQLGSFRHESEVHQQWQFIQKKYKDVLGDVKYWSEKADLGSKGIFYRLKVGPYKSEEAARETCHSLSERNQGCFFVK